MRAATTRPQTRPSVLGYSQGPHAYPRRSTSNRVCPICKQVGRSNIQHSLEWIQTQEEDRRYMAEVRHVVDLIDDEH